MQLAMGLEYFHTASLVFDDLPFMDNAAERRGKPCLHVLFGEACATLAALALINRAYALVWSAVTVGSPFAQQSALRYVERDLGVGQWRHPRAMEVQLSASAARTLHRCMEARCRQARCGLSAAADRANRQVRYTRHRHARPRILFRCRRSRNRRMAGTRENSRRPAVTEGAVMHGSRQCDRVTSG